jgi:hypothetical protein
MDGLALLGEAHAAGLHLTADGDKLVITGPKCAHAVAKKIIAAKPVVMSLLWRQQEDIFADLPPNDSAYEGEWLRWFGLLVSHKLQIGQGNRTHEEAYELAYGEATNFWRERYGQRPDPHRCAGCGKPIGRSNPMTLPDGARVHDADLRCLIAYGERWRTAAGDALSRLGIEPAQTSATDQ